MTYDLTLDEIEAENARISADFHGIPEDMEPWILRDIARKAAPWLGLSDGARLHLLDQLALIGDPAWRSSTPRAYRGVIRSALAHQKSERQITRYEHEIIRAGFAYRTVKHGRRHGGSGGNGLDFSPFAVRLDHFAALATKAVEIEEEHGAARAAYRAAVRRIYQAIERATALPSLRNAALEVGKDLEATKIKRITARMTIHAIDAARAVLDALFTRLESLLATVDSASVSIRESEQSDILDRHTKTTTEPSNPKGTCSGNVDKRSRLSRRASHSQEGRANARHCIEGKKSAVQALGQPPETDEGLGEAILATALSIASPDMLEAYRRAPACGWPGLVRAAETRLTLLGIHPTAWHEACARMGMDHAALSIVIIEAKASLPVEDERFVGSPGGYLRGLSKRARNGVLNLERSLFGIAKAAV